MLRVSEAAALALHAAVFLAVNEDRVIPTAEIAEMFKASDAHLSKVLQRLHKAGLVSSTRGPKGGFQIARPADEITLLQVYETIEGKLSDTECLFDAPVCDGEQCILGDLLKKVNSQVREYMANTRLGELAEAFEFMKIDCQRTRS
jgi:Rrf2 family protein